MIACGAVDEAKEREAFEEWFQGYGDTDSKMDLWIGWRAKAWGGKPPPSYQAGCRAKLAPGHHWRFCGETDMGQTLPALCKQCGGEYERDR